MRHAAEERLCVRRAERHSKEAQSALSEQQQQRDADASAQHTHLEPILFVSRWPGAGRVGGCTRESAARERHSECRSRVVVRQDFGFLGGSVH